VGRMKRNGQSDFSGGDFLFSGISAGEKKKVRLEKWSLRRGVFWGKEKTSGVFSLGSLGPIQKVVYRSESETP